MVRAVQVLSAVVPCFGQELFLAARSSSDLEGCLHSGGFQGSLPDVEEVRSQNFVQEGFNQKPGTVDVPRVAVEVQSKEDVAVAVSCAAQTGYKICSRSGGNSFTGASFACSEEQTMVLDLHALKDLTYDAGEGTVTLQPGLTLGQALLKLKTQSNDEATMVTGNCVGVGAGGFLLGGGMGALDSVAGLLCDNLRSAEFVLADGSIVVADHTQNQELLWAACGGGGAGLAVMVSATVSSYPTAEVGTGVCTRATFPDSVDPAEVLPQWLQYQQKAAHLRMQIRDGNLYVFGCFFGESLESYGSLEQKTGITSYETEDKWSYSSWVDVIKFLGPPGDFGTHQPTIPDSELEHTQWAHSGWFNNLRSRSLLLGDFHDSVDEEIGSTLHKCKRGSSEDGTDEGYRQDGKECVFIPVGEKVRERSSADAAFPYRSAQISFEVISEVLSDADRAWVDDIWGAFASSSYKMGSYVNYPDLGLPDYQHMYWGSNYEQLRELKERYDAERLFAAPQPIA